MPDAKWSFWKDEAKFSFLTTASRLRTSLSLLGGILAIGVGGLLGPSVGVPALLSWVISAIVVPLVLYPANLAFDLYSKGDTAGTALKTALDAAASPRATVGDINEKDREISRMKVLAESLLDTHRHRRT
jgi:hypothetical protein